MLLYYAAMNHSQTVTATDVRTRLRENIPTL